DSAKAISQILILVSAAGAYSWLVTTSGFPAQLVEVIASYHLETWLLLLVINIVLLFVGTVLEPPAAILILTPLLGPRVGQAGVAHHHFRVVATVDVQGRSFALPVGLNHLPPLALVDIRLQSVSGGLLPVHAS